MVILVMVALGCRADDVPAGAFGLGAVSPPTVEWPPRHYVAYRTEVPLTIDGLLEEPAWREAPWTADFVDIEGSSRPLPRFRTAAKMLWDSAFFYIGAELEEPHVWGTLTERDAVVYLDNDFEVFIDPDGDTHEYYELEINALGTEWDLLLVKPYRDGGPAIHAWDIPGLRTAVRVDGTLNDPANGDRGWSVEIALPWRALAEAAHRPSPPDPGDQWRVNFSRVQWRARIGGSTYEKITEPLAGRARPEDNWVWSPQGIINMHYPETWGIVQFSAAVAGQANEPFQPSPDDRAKWALRWVYYAERAWFADHGTFTADVRSLDLPEFDIPGYGPRPHIAVTSSLFEASLSRDDGTRLRIAQDGRVW